MAEVVAASLGGVPLSLRPSETIGWTLRAGTTPVQKTFTVTRARALRILERAKVQFASQGMLSSVTRKTVDKAPGPLTLRVVAPGYKPLVVKGLYAVSAAPADENRLGVVVVDRRWLWRRVHILREYNVRKLVGDRRLVGNEMQRIDIRESAADFSLRRVTLNNGQPWTARQVLTDILTQLVGTGQFRIERMALMKDVVDLVLDDTGESALRRVLSYLPGAQCYIDTDGRVVVYNSLGGGEAAALAAAGTPYPGGRQVELIDHSLTRPRKVISLFEVEPEIRFDYLELTGTETRTKPVPGREPRHLENVVPVTDPTLEVSGRTVSRGTWLPVEQWFPAVAGLEDYPGGAKGRKILESLGELTEELIRKHYVSGFGHLRNKFVCSQLGLPDPLWSLRLDAITSHWRTTFRLLPQWRDKIKSIRAIRAGIIDIENGTRGKSTAYFDYTVRPSKRTHAKNYKDGKHAAWEIRGYADDLKVQYDGNGTLVKGAQPGPADVVVIEPTNGTFQLVYHVDPWGDNVSISPGTLEQKTIPIVSPGDADAVWNSTFVALEPNWRLAVILTVALAAPNSQSRLHGVSVPIGRALTLLPAGIKSTRALGPDWVLRVGAGIQTARFSWSDAHATQIENAIFSDVPYPSELLVNGPHLKAIAEANAARIHALLQDRHQGEQLVSLNPDVKPAGSLTQVTHIVGYEACVTHMTLPAIATPPDVLAMLPDSTRKLIQRSVQAE